MKWPWLKRKWRVMGQMVGVKLGIRLGADPDGSKVLGHCNAATNAIEIDRDLSEIAALEIFWHEMFHIFEDAAGCDWEERDIKLLARMFSGLWADNAPAMLDIAKWMYGRAGK